MKNIYVIVSAFFTFLFLTLFPLSAFSQTNDRSHFDYWLNKMEDPDQNYYELVTEFDNYWKNKDLTNTKGTGYKQFKRWQYARAGMTGEDGKLLPASYFTQEIKNFKQLYGGKSIIGDWQFVGPDIVPVQPDSMYRTGIGRLACIAFHPNDPNTIYVGSHSGGIWKTTTGGNNWTNQNTDELTNIGVSAIMIHPSNPFIIFIGTGDRDNNHVPGQGIWKSEDGGTSWTQINSDMDDKLVSEILIQPDNYNVLLAAADDGVYISTNGGDNWTKSIGIDVNVKDMTYKPGDPAIVYATGNGEFYRSVSCGANWSKITSGLFNAGRSIIGVTPDASNKVFIFATRESHFEGFYVSTNSGQDFTKKSTSAFSGEKQGGFNIALAIDPTNENIIFAGMVAVFKSTNGGNSWTKLDLAWNIHADQHDFKFSPHTNDLYLGNDGGLFFSNDVGDSFTNLGDGLEITQVARMAVSETSPDIFMAGLQDNGTIIPYNGEYNRVLSGDGMNCAIDYTDDQYMYGSWQFSDIRRSVEGAQYSVAWANISSSIDEDAGWFRPFTLDKDNPNIIFAGYQNVWRSTNVKITNPASVSWTNISGGKLNDDKTIGVMEQSLSDGNIIYISKGDGDRLYRTDNAYVADPDWVEITKPYGWPVKCLETHPTDPDIVYMVIGRYVYKSNDRGENWTSIKENFPDIPMKSIVYHVGSNEGLYIGTLAGVYYKDADMADWVLFKTGLPFVAVADMKIIYSTDPDRLVVGTWGRGVWKTDVLPDMKPDLRFTNANATVTDTDVDIDVVLVNDSQMGDAGPYFIGYYLSENDIISTGDYLIGEDSINLHAPGIIVAEDILVDVSDIEPEIPSGTYYIGAYVDNRFEVDETDETNNRITCSQQVTIPDPPAAPTNVQASDGTYGDKIVISWDPPPGSTDYHYKVYRNTINNPGTATPVSPDPWNTNTTWWDETATDGIIYHYWIQASDTYLGFRAGAFSTSDNGYQYLSPPTDVEATDGQYDDRVVISWEPPEGATYYKVWRNTSTDFNTADPLSTTWTPNTNFNDWTATQLTTYFYWVKSAMSSSGLRESPYNSSYETGWVALMGAPEADATDGLYDDRIDITWNTIPGASHYMVYKSTVDDPNTAAAMGAVWQTTTNRTDYSVDGGTYYYYWIKAGTDQWGANATEFGEGDSGWRNYVPPTITAGDGTNTDCIELSWTAVPDANYYMVFRNTNPITSSAIAVSEWIDQLSFNDSTAAAPGDYFYWVKASNNSAGLFESDFSSYDVGWRKLYAPEVEATKGAYADKVRVTWDPVPGANSYRVIRFTPSTGIYDTLSDWSSTLNYQYNDYDVEYGNYWTWLYYYVDAAYNNYGAKPGDQGHDYGYPGECGNLTDDPNYRSINFHGTTLEITQRVINNGSFPLTNPSEVGYALEETPPVASWNYFLGKADIPALAVGAYYDAIFVVDLETIPDGPVNYGTWTVASYMPMGGTNCQSNHHDDYLIWENIPFVYNDALYGTYTIGGTAPDFPSFTNAVTNLINKGISDHVTFNVRPNTYYEQVQIPAINGSGQNRTITFQTEPNKSDTAEINFSNNEGNFTIQFDGASYITIKNLKLTSPGFTDNQSTYGRVISFSSASHHISLLNNIISGTSDDSYISEDNVVIYCENSFCNDIEIKDNEILNGSWGIYFHGVGSGTDLSTGLEISGNSIHNFMYAGISLQFQQTPQINENTIQYFTSTIAQCYGIELSNIEEGFTIDKNQVIMEPCENVVFGIYLYDCAGSAVNRGLASNNFVAMSSNAHPLYGITVFMSSYTDIYYNSVNITGTNFQDNFCINLDCADDAATYNNNVLNNIFSNQAGGYSILIGDNAITHNYVVLSDYNDLHNTGSYIGLYGNTNQISDLTAWQAASGFDSHSVSTDPQYLSSTDLHVLSPALNDAAVPVSSVTEDIDGEARHPLYPDIGADEFMPPPPDYDIYVSDIISPVTGEGLTDQETINIDIYNVGSENVSNFPVSYSINGGAPVTEIITGTLNTFDVMNYSFTTKADLSVVGTYEIESCTSLANDEVPGNDCFTINVEHLPPTYSYCIPVYTEDCFNYGYSIEDFYLNTIQHQWSWCSEMSYGDFTGISTDLEQGQSYAMEVSTGMDYMYVSLWIDLDDDTFFEPSEKFVTDLYCEFSYTIYSASMNIPVSTNPGRHRMRVRAVYDETNFDPCDEYMYGEVHDYSVNIVSGGGLSVDLGYDRNVCYGIPITIPANVTGGTSPYSYLWSSGEITSSILVSPVSDTIYSIMVTDVLGYSTIDEVEIYTKQNPEAIASSNSPVCEGSDIMLNGLGNYYGIAENRCISNCELPTYCASKAAYIEGPIVEEVIFGSINNNTIEICGNYSDYTSLKTIVSIGDTIELNITLNDCDLAKPFYKGGKAYIDWNRDGDFEDSNELVGIFDIVEYEGYYDTSVIVPTHAELGKTLLRIVCRDAPILDSIQPCGSYFFGETEDYTIEIIETIDNSIDFYSWTGPDSYSSIEQNPVIPSSVPGNSGTYALTITDGNGCTASDNTDVTVMAEPTAFAGENDTICETETLQLSGQATNYSSLLWTTSGTGAFDNNAIPDAVYTPSAIDINNGEVTLTLLAYANAPCSNNALSALTLIIIKQSVVFAGNDATINEGETYLLYEASALYYNSLEWLTSGTGTFNNPNILNPEYTPGTGETGSISLILTGLANSPCIEQKDTMELEIIPYAGFDLDIKVFLYGPFNGSDMNTDLNPILPLSQPYNTSPWNYLGTETTALIPNPDIVDWILVELRDTTDALSAIPGTIIAQQAAFLLNDGTIVGLNGSSFLSFDNSISHSLFVVIRHRNHIEIISSNPLVRIGEVYSYNFTIDDLQVLGGSLGYKELVPGTWGMAGGDGDANGKVETVDKTNIWLPQAGTRGYKISDFNMDTQVDNKDKNDIWHFNSGKESQVPE